MNSHRVIVRRFAFTVAASAMLAGCSSPMAPTVSVMPGPGKSFASFQTDDSACRVFSNNQVKPLVDASGRSTTVSALVSTIQAAAAGDTSGGSLTSALGPSADQANIQAQYDTAYSQCMFSKGDQVPGYGRGYAAQSAPPDPTVRATQVELNRLGYLREPADGYAGGHTRSAIVSFEQANGMPADGVASSRLLARLQSTTTNASAPPPAWVAPTDAPHQTAAASPAASPGWVSPTSSASSSTAASSSTGWVTPTKTQ